MIRAALLAAAALLVAEPADAEEKILRIYNFTDYTAPDLVKAFEAETGIEVSIDTFDANETMVAKLRAGGTGYDVAIATSDFLPILISQKLIQPVEAAKLANFGKLDTRWQRRSWDPDGTYSVPWMWGTTSYQVDSALYKGPVDSLKLLFEPPDALRGKIGMLGSPSEAINVAMVYLGFPICDTDPAHLKTVNALLEAQKPFVKVYNSDGQRERQVSGETIIHQAWNGESVRGRLQKPSLTYVYGKEGVVAWMDNVVVPVGAPHVENARRFMDFIMRPDIIAMESNFSGYANAVSGSERFLSADYATAPELFPPADVKLVWNAACPEEATRKYDMIWTHLRQ